VVQAGFREAIHEKQTEARHLSLDGSRRSFDEVLCKLIATLRNSHQDGSQIRRIFQILPEFTHLSRPTGVWCSHGWSSDEIDPEGSADCLRDFTERFGRFGEYHLAASVEQGVFCPRSSLHRPDPALGWTRLPTACLSVRGSFVQHRDWDMR
jgi:hypothetical protein